MQATKDQGSTQYVDLFKSLYIIAVSSSSLPILEQLFSSVKEDSLSLLMGIWLGSLPPQSDKAAISTAALQHSTALLTAFAGQPDGIDFQTVLPSLVVALENGLSSLATRTAAADSIRLLNIITVSKTFDRIYAFDAIYGPSRGS